MDWLPAVMTLIGVLVGVGIQEIRIWREKKDKYKDMVFEKRLDAHQGAYYWCMRLSGVVMPHSLAKDGGTQPAVKVLGEALEWLDKNALYLDEDSRIKMDALIGDAYGTASRYEDKEGRGNINEGKEERRLSGEIREALASIKTGVGVRYLPERRIPREYIKARKQLGKLLKATVKSGGKQRN